MVISLRLRRVFWCGMMSDVLGGVENAEGKAGEEVTGGEESSYGTELEAGAV